MKESYNSFGTVDASDAPFTPLESLSGTRDRHSCFNFELRNINIAKTTRDTHTRLIPSASPNSHRLSPQSVLQQHTTSTRISETLANIHNAVLDSSSTACNSRNDSSRRCQIHHAGRGRLNSSWHIDRGVGRLGRLACSQRFGHIHTSIDDRREHRCHFGA